MKENRATFCLNNQSTLCFAAEIRHLKVQGLCIRETPQHKWNPTYLNREKTRSLSRKKHKKMSKENENQDWTEKQMMCTEQTGGQTNQPCCWAAMELLG